MPWLFIFEGFSSLILSITSWSPKWRYAARQCRRSASFIVKHLKNRNGVAPPCRTCLYCLRRRALLRFFIYSTIPPSLAAAHAFGTNIGRGHGETKSSPGGLGFVKPHEFLFFGIALSWCSVSNRCSLRVKPGLIPLGRASAATRTAIKIPAGAGIWVSR